MILKYLPPDSIIIKGITLKFNEHRISVRNRLMMDYKEDNQTIPLPDLNEEPLYMRRDIYKGISATETFFFLSYDKNDLLAEVEVHQCEKIEVAGITFYFDDDLDSVALMLSAYSEIRILSRGEIFFKDLKMVISDKEKMGGEGNSIGYFYCADDVTHIG